MSAPSSSQPAETSNSGAIEISPGTCGGKPRIAGTRIRVQDIAVWHERQGQSADEIVSAYPHLTLTGVYEALAYYHAHRQEIDEQMKRGEEFAEALRAKFPSKLEAKAEHSD